MLLAFDGDDHLIEMPLVAKFANPGPNPFGGLLAKLQRPRPKCFLRDLDAASRQHFFDHAQAQGKRKYNHTA